MAKKADSEIVVASRLEADWALTEIGKAAERIATYEQVYRDRIRDAEQWIKEAKRPYAERVSQLESALKDWAKKDQRNWTAKHIELPFGKIGFRLPPPAIKILLGVATVIERLRARKMETCIRVKETIKKESLAAYDDTLLEKLGCKRTQGREKFFYELKPKVE